MRITGGSTNMYLLFLILLRMGFIEKEGAELSDTL